MLPEIAAALTAVVDVGEAVSVTVTATTQPMTEPTATVSKETDMTKYRKRPVVIEATQWFLNGDHPQDGVGQPRMDEMTGETYVGVEGLVVRFFRHPDVPGEGVHDECGRTWHDHGWIETPPGGYDVCPGDWIISDSGWHHPCKPDIFAATYEAIETPQPTVADLIAAEQRRARRRHPNDHAGHPDTTDIERLNILDSEFDEVEREIYGGNAGTAMVWEVLQVAAVAAAWVEAWLADPEAMSASDLLAIIEDGVIR